MLLGIRDRGQRGADPHRLVVAEHLQPGGGGVRLGRGQGPHGGGHYQAGLAQSEELLFGPGAGEPQLSKEGSRGRDRTGQSCTTPQGSGPQEGKGQWRSSGGSQCGGI